MAEDFSIRQIVEFYIRKSGKTKKEIAEAAGLYSGSFNKSLSNPTVETIKKIASALGLKPYQLMKTDDEIERPEPHSVIIDGIEYVPKVKVSENK